MAAFFPLRSARVRANGLEFGLLEAGSGPLALCLHGFLEASADGERHDETIPAVGC
jgi:hypothetical protein